MTYAKAVIAVIVSFAGALTTVLGTGNDMTLDSLSGAQWLGVILAALGSGGMVWLVSNIPGVAGGIMKTVVAFLTAGISSLITALDDHHVSQAELLVAFIAAITATGLVYQTPNAARVVQARLRRP